ncbi:MAG: hypothetical protein ACMXYL_01560 [Candidatus Woesearchaeota archaeon]
MGMGDNAFTQEEKSRITRYDDNRKKKYAVLSVGIMIISIILLSLLLFLSTTLYYGLSQSTHNNIITRLGIEIVSEYARDQTDPYVINSHILEYFRSDDDLIRVNYLEEDEKIHLSYVKNAIVNMKRANALLLLGSIIAIILYYIISRLAGNSTKESSLGIARIIQYSSITVIVAWALVFLLLVPADTQRFVDSSRIIPETLMQDQEWNLHDGNLLEKVYPKEFFHSLGLSIIRLSMLTMTIIFIISTLVLLFIQDKKSKT